MMCLVFRKIEELAEHWVFNMRFMHIRRISGDEQKSVSKVVEFRDRVGSEHGDLDCMICCTSMTTRQPCVWHPFTSFEFLA
jgi:hypothetical protein